MTNLPDDSSLNISEANRVALGPLHSIHLPASGMHKFNIVGTLGFLLVTWGPAIYFLIDGFRSPRKDGLGVAAMFGGLGLLPAIGLVYVLHQLRWKLFLFANGFVLVRRASRVVLWEDVLSITEVAVRMYGIKTDRRLRLLLNDKKRITLDASFQDFESFASAVRDHVAAVVMKRADEALPAGRAIAFGDLKLSQHGLQNARGSLPWEEVHSITMEPRLDGQIHALAVVVYRNATGRGKEKAEWYWKLVPRFGNVDVFLHLASRFTKVVGPDQAR